MDAMNAYTMPGLKFKDQYTRIIDMEFILKTICDYYNLPVSKVDSKSRRRELAQARHIFMYLVATHTKTTLTTIGYFFRCQYDHTTVMHAREHIKDLMFSDPDIKLEVENLKIECGL